MRLVISDAHEGSRAGDLGDLGGGRLSSVAGCTSAEAPQARPRPSSGSGPDHLRLKGTGRQLDQVCATLQRRFPQVAHMLQEAAEEVLTYMHFPPES